MRCKGCQAKATVEVRHHNAAYCNDCFQDYFLKRVQHNIRAYKMFSPGDRVLLVVSGGKDSLSLWDALIRLGYQVTALYIDLGIEGYSQRSGDKCREFAAKNGTSLGTISVKEVWGLSIPEIARKTRRTPCAVCGRIKRYLFNKCALEGSFPVVATGHNLDDEAASLLGNLLHWQTGYLARQQPNLPATHPKLVKKVKPLYTLTERECLAYALIRNIPYLAEDCPYAEGATSITYKEALNHIEAASPGTKLSFLKGFLKHKGLFREYDGEVELRECSRCGQVTTEEVCSVCRLLERAQKRSAAQQK
ncbi:MAG: TIGR00269 family protein [Thermoanaerobacteraceae bacterium]|uniref:TIGR00269 family protein n=1 Tax=Thermanaeromonas sp. C210 TaxID=2731925 RepID=UPI00155BAFE9|nr:TIGR00269 family protein [Thermanaeromonas sp. C210]MBE3580991.1 TIGR00269 family protein [Thermoanaerobacteraceae bacterium]GFN23594.1 tRNA(Ile)-lysidine synthetase [Thermanaeromonas sp. C210]